MCTLIELKNVTVTRNKINILSDVSWVVKAGENWAVIGRNGSGKSFLLRLLSTLIYPSSGEVKILGEQMGQVDIWGLREHIGIVSDLLQSEYKSNTRVRDVVASGFYASNGLYHEPSLEQYAKSDELLDTLGVSDLSKRWYGELSQGEQKRVLITRSLVFDPQLIILDEPTTGLDVKSREDFLETLRTIIKLGHSLCLLLTMLRRLSRRLIKLFS